MMNEFDKIIAEKLASADYPVNEAMWTAIESNLNPPSAGVSETTSFHSPLVAGIAATAMLASVMIWSPDDHVPVSEDATHSSATELSIESESTDQLDPVNVWQEDPKNHRPQESHVIPLMEAALSQDDEELRISTSEAIGDEPASSKAEAVIQDNEVVEVPSIEFSAQGIQCIGSDVQFVAQGGENGVYEWIIDGIYVLEGPEVMHSFEEAGEHEVLLLSEFNDQVLRTKRSITIYENPSSVPSFQVNEVADCFMQQVSLRAQPGENTYVWSTQEEAATGNEAMMMLNQGNHDVVLTSVNEHGCTQEQHVLVSVESGLKLFIPNSFSPNADGDNDAWIPVGLERCTSHSLKVFRATDNALVFETTQAEAWNGTFNGAVEPIQRGEAFIYRLVATDACGNQEEHQGRITALP